jgi:hypothetical protein
MSEQKTAMVEMSEAEMAAVEGGAGGMPPPTQGACDDIVSYIRDVITQPAT